MKGFTLVETMIAVAIVGILAAIAYPSYQESVRKSKRIDAQSQMIDIASKLQKYKIANFRFFQSGTETPITLAYLKMSEFYPLSGQAIYDLKLNNVTSGTWEMEAIPKAGTLQEKDGTLRLNYRGERCWAKAQTTCILDENSNWDGK